jgi:tetratricopeptide (TPR) repeat protein
MREPILAKILRYFVYAAAFVPLIIFNDYISPFHFGKVVIFRSLVELMVVFYLLLVWKDRSYLPKFNIITWSFLAFASAFTLATLTSVIPYMSAWGSLERMGGVVTFWHYFVYFIILTSVFKKESDWMNLFKLVIAIGVMSAFYGFLQRTDLSWIVGSGGRSRIFGTIGNPALFAGYQILCLFLSLTLFFKKENSQNLRIFFGASSLIFAIATMMTAVRGSILGVGVGFLALALLYSSVYRSQKARKALLGLIGLLVVFIMMAVLLKNTSFVQNSGYLRRITNFSLTDYTVQTRFWAWEAGLKGWKESPKTILLGWGPENFNIPFSKYFNPKFFRGPGSETLFDRAHNMFVEILVTMGLVGFLAYISIFFSALKVLWGKMKNKETVLYGVGFIPLLIAYAIHNAFIFDTSANFLTFFTILGFIYFLASHHPNGNNDKKPIQKLKINEGLWFFSAIGLFAFALVAIFFINIQPSRANYTSTRGIVLGWSSDFKGAVKKFQEAISYGTPGKYEIRHRYAQYVLETTNSKEITPEVAEIVKDTIKEVEKNIDENPQDYLPLLYASRLNIILGKDDPASPHNDRALELSLRALEISPTFVRTYYEIGQAYLNKKDLAKAAEQFKKAAELNPEVGLSYWYWGVVELERGNSELGLSILEEILEKGMYVPSENDMNRLISVYIKQKNYPKIAWGYEILVRNAPSNAQYRASYAVALANIGKIDEAVEQAREAAKLDPKFEPEAKAFIQSLGRTY